jgi:hypothetical protein
MEHDRDRVVGYFSRLVVGLGCGPARLRWFSSDQSQMYATWSAAAN